MSCQREGWWDLSTATQIKLSVLPLSLSVSLSLSATTSCNHCELAPRHEHSLGHISTGFFDLSSFKPHTCACTATQYDPTPNLTQFFFFTGGLSTTSAWCKNILSVIKDVGSDWLGERTCGRWQPMERMEDNKDWVTCTVADACVCARVCVCVCVWYLYQQWKCRCKEVRTLGKHLCLQDRRNALLNACSAARGCKSTHTHTHTRTYARTHTHASFGMNTFQFLELTLTPHCSRHLSSPPASCLSAWSRNQDYHIAQFMSIQMEQKGKSKTWVGDKVHICPVL